MSWRARGVGGEGARGKGLYRDDGFSGGEAGICDE